MNPNDDLISELDKDTALILQLHKELAAEREVGHNQAIALGQHIVKLEDQLADEREWREQMIDQLEIMRQQLDAAVEALKVAALFVSDGYNAGCPSRTRVRETIDAALAKFGGAK